MDMLVVGLVGAGIAGGVVDGFLRKSWMGWALLFCVVLGVVLLVAGAMSPRGHPESGIVVLVIPVWAAMAVVPYAITRGVFAALRGLSGGSRSSSDRRLLEIAERLDASEKRRNEKK